MNKPLALIDPRDMTTAQRIEYIKLLDQGLIDASWEMAEMQDEINRLKGMVALLVVATVAS